MVPVRGRGSEPALQSLCLLPQALASEQQRLERFLAGEGLQVSVVVDRRREGDRRRCAERRQDQEPWPEAEERRKVKSATGRRIADRRATLEPAEAPKLPRKFRDLEGAISFVTRVELSAERAADIEAARLVVAFQSGERSSFAEIYQRYFDPVYTYLRIVLRNSDEAEDAAQQVFLKAFEALPRYELRQRSFQGWLFTIARNTAVSLLRVSGRLELEEPTQLDRRRENGGSVELPMLDWISDKDLLMFIERLPLAQRQVLLLRFMLDLTAAEAAKVLGRTEGDIGVLQHRAIAVLRKRLASVGRGPARSRGGSTPMERYTKPAYVLRRRRFALLKR